MNFTAALIESTANHSAQQHTHTHSTFKRLFIRAFGNKLLYKWAFRDVWRKMCVKKKYKEEMCAEEI